MNMVDYQKTTKEKKIQLWYNMYTRCYNLNYHKVKPGYKGCAICNEWLDDKKSFYEWVDMNFYKIKGGSTVELDKDILLPGNKLYSPDACIFVPKRINDLFVHIHGRTNNGLPTGVTYSEKTGMYKVTARLTHEGTEKKKKNVILGYYDTMEEAYEVYKEHKKAEIIYIADLYKKKIPDKLYQAMVNWEFDEIKNVETA